MSTFYKVQTGFQIVDSNGVPGTPIDGISSELTESVSKLPTDKAVYDAIEAAKQECKSVLASSEEVEVTGVGTEESPYTLDLTGKVHSSTGVDLQSEEGSDITMFSSLDIGATANRNISMEAGYNINMKAAHDISLHAPNLLTEEAQFEILTIAPYEYNYVSNKWAVAQSNDADARNIQFDGSLGEYVYRKTVTSTGPISETAAGPLSIVSSGATAEFKGAGPTTVESTGGAPVTVKSNGDSSNYSSLVVTPNAGTLSVNASTADHTLSMFSKSVVEGTTNITELNLNDSTGASLHSSYAPIRVTADNAPIYLSSPAGAPIQIVSQTIGGQYGYALVQTQGTSVTLKSYWDSTANGELAMSVNTMKLTQKGDANSYLELQSRNDTANPAVYSDLKLTPTSATISIPTTTSPTWLMVSGDSSISGSAKTITLLAGVAQGDTGTATINIGAVQGNTNISGSSIYLIGAPNGGLMIDSNGTRIIDPSHQVSVSSDTFAVNVKYDSDEQHYSSSLDMGTNASLSSYNTVGLYNNESGSSLELPNNGKIVGEAYGDIDLEAHDGSHAILRGTGSSGGSDWEAKLDLNFNSSTLSSNAGPINITNTGSTVNVTSVGETAIKAGLATISGYLNNGTYGSTLSIGGTVSLTSTTGPITINSTIAPVNISAGASSTFTSVGNMSLTSSSGSMSIGSVGTLSLASSGNVVNIDSVGPTTITSSQAGINLNSLSTINLASSGGPIYLDSNGGAPIRGKVVGDSTHYSEVTQNVTGLSASVAGAPSPLSFSMVGDSTLGTSSATLSAKNISLIALQLPSDTTGSSSIYLNNPPYGSISLNSNGVSIMSDSPLPTRIATTELILPGYNNAFDSTTTHKVMVHAASDGGVELAEMSDLTNEQFGLDSTTESGSILVVEQVGEPGEEEPSVVILAPGTTGQVLSVGSSGLEWTTPSVGTDWYCGSFTSANRPANPTEGQYGYDTTIDCVIYYIGGYWKNSAGAIV